MGNVQIQWGLFLDPWGNLGEVLKYVVAPKNIIVHDIVTAHVSGSNPTHSHVLKILSLEG